MPDLLYAFKTGDRVVKPKGYPFPGEVRAAFTNKAGKPRYVVELDGVSGLLHIFNGEQLRNAETFHG